LLGITRFDALDADTQAQPPNRKFAQVEQSVRGSERHAVVAADVGGQATLLKKPLKYWESVVFSRRRKRFTSEQKTAGVIADRERITVVGIAEQELAFVIRTPELIRPLSQRQWRPVRTTTYATAPLHQAVAIEHRMDGAFGGDGDTGEPARQALADFARAPAGMLTLHIQNVVLDLKGKSVRVTKGTPASVREPADPAFLVAIEDLVAGFARNPELPAQFRHGFTRQPPSHKLHSFIHNRTLLPRHCTSSPELVVSLEK
jgi:hypothetical protein